MSDKKCSACGAPIIFIKTPAGAWLPCEKYPVAYRVNDDGENPDTLVDNQGKTFRGKIGPPTPGSKLAHIPHWKYCTGAAQVRKATRAAKAAAKAVAKKAEQPATWEQTSLF